MRNIAIIPTREKSKRIPMKAVINFFGKPIIQYPLDEIKKSEIFNRVIVSTDSLDIAKMSGHRDVVFTDLSDEKETLSNKIEKTLSCIEEEYDWAFICYPTSALLRSDVILDSFNIVKNKKYNLISLCKYDRPIQRAIHINGKLCKMKYPRFKQKNSQDLESFYFDAGQFYWVNLKRFRKRAEIIDSQNIPYILNESDCQDVDTFDDLLKLKMKYNAKNG